jgi:hypothetical protein
MADLARRLAPSGDARAAHCRHDPATDTASLERTMTTTIAGAGCALITPARNPGWQAAAVRWWHRAGDAWRPARAPRSPRPQVDAATLRDLGLGHAAQLAAGVDPVERRARR